MLTLTIARFDADPDAVTDLLGLAPTSVARRGEARPSGRLHDFNKWQLELHVAPLTDGREHATAIDALIGQLKGREHLFAEVAKTIRPASISIYGGYYVSDEQQGVWLDSDQMAGVVKSKSSKAPLQLAFPATLASRWMPGLFPEKPAQA